MNTTQAYDTAPVVRAIAGQVLHTGREVHAIAARVHDNVQLVVDTAPPVYDTKERASLLTPRVHGLL